MEAILTVFIGSLVCLVFVSLFRPFLEMLKRNWQ